MVHSTPGPAGGPDRPSAALEEHPGEAPFRGFVVGIGASAGGLEALERLFGALPADTGAAFVVVQHLSPDHKSMMDNLLARYTDMPGGMRNTASGASGISCSATRTGMSV